MAGGICSTALHGTIAARVGTVRLFHRTCCPASGEKAPGAGAPRSSPEQL